MNLLTKFNLVCVSVFAIALVAAGVVSYTVLQNNARGEVTRQARLMMETALASRDYTSRNVKPLLNDKLAERFLPETVPAFAATQSMQYLQKNYPDFSYKEATLNPTNRRDLAKGYEVNVVKAFRRDAKAREILGIRDTPRGQFIYLSRPIRITDSQCLACHSTPKVAPASMLKKYGDKHGFGWKLNEVVGAQIVSVPTHLPYRLAGRTFHTLMLALLSVFVVTLLIINVMLRRLVIAPVTHLSQVADDISMGRLESADLPVKGEDEIATLTGSFNRMQRSLQQALKLLER